MDELDKIILQSFDDNEEKFPTIDYLLDKLISFMEENYGATYSSEEDSYFADEPGLLRYSVSEIVRKACLEILWEIKHGRTDDVKLINYVLRTDIDTLITEFLYESSVAHEIVKSYVVFIIMRFKHRLSSKKELESINKRNPWLDQIVENRGFETLNDKARKILGCLYEMSSEKEDKDSDWEIIDEYFSSDKLDNLVKEDAPEFFCSNRSSWQFKLYQLRLMYADVYATLEFARKNDEDFSDYEMLKEIEEVISGQLYLMPEEREKRFKFYKVYFSSMYDLIVPEIRDSFDRTSSAKIIKMANPLFYLD